MTTQEIDKLIEEGNSLKQIAQAYSEIASLKIKRIRGQVERNRLFFAEISQVYGLVKALAKKRGLALDKGKKRLCMIITSNYRFYGQINSSLINFFIPFANQIETDLIFLGKAAIDYFKSGHIGKNPRQIILESDQPNPGELSRLVSIIKQYNQVLIFHSRLKTLLLQQPVFTDITAQSDLYLPEKGQNIKFIFEPDLPKILAFFDSQILTLLLEGTFLESEVARTASRFISMDTAETQANKFIKEYRNLKAYTQRSLKDNQSLESIARVLTMRKKVYG